MKHSLPCWNHWMLDVGTQQPADGSKRHAGYAKADGTRQDCKRIKKKKRNGSDDAEASQSLSKKIKKERQMFFNG